MGWWFKMVLWQRVMGALVLGVIAGLILGDNAVWLKPIGDVFVTAIRMLVVPLIFTTLVAGVIGMGEPAKLGTIGLRAIGLYLGTTLVAVSIGLGFGTLFKPGAGVDFSDVVPHAVSTESVSLTERLINIIPANPFNALASGDVLSIIFFAILVGIAILTLGEKGKPVGDLFQSGADIMFKITHWVMELAPFGVFALIAWVTGTKGIETFSSILVLAAAVYLGCITHIILVYGGLLRFVLGLPLVRFFRGILDAQAVAFSTSSSSGTLPVTIACVQENLGVKPSIASSVLPLGATINMDGTSLYLGILALFAAQAFGIDLSFGDYLMIAITATLASIGAAGIPSASLFLLATVLTVFNVSPEQTAIMVGFILPFDRLLDMMRTLTNVTGDAAVATAVAKWEGELDEDIYRKVATV